MNRKYLVAVDGSDQGWKALDVAATLAVSTGAEVVPVHVVRYEAMPDALGQWAEMEGLTRGELDARFHQNRAIGDRIIREAEDRLRKAGVADIRPKVVEGHVAREIVALAADMGADMLFLGSRGLSEVQGLLLGSVSHRVLHLAPCSCVLVR